MKDTPTLEKISPIQLFILMFLFIQSSAVVVGVGHEAKEDVWIATLIATGVGAGLFVLFIGICHMHPNKSLYKLMEVAFGKKISIGLSIIFVEIFFIIASRTLRDFCELISTVSYPNTPIIVIALLFSIVISYILYLGIEVLGRSSEVFFPYTTGFLILITLFLYFGKQIHFENLKPFLAHGVKPIMQAVFPDLIVFSFGEVFVFTTILGFVYPLQKGKKAGLLSVVTAGIILTYFTIIKISVLSFEINKNSLFPLLNAARQVSLANFIERLDALVVFVMMIGIFVKVSIYLFSVLKGIEYITHKCYRQFNLPVCLLNGISSVLMAANYQEHITKGTEFTIDYILFPAYIIFPVILYGTLRWKKSGNGGKSNHGLK